jgi:hypothetical protein
VLQVRHCPTVKRSGRELRLVGGKSGARSLDGLPRYHVEIAMQHLVRAPGSQCCSIYVSTGPWPI